MGNYEDATLIGNLDVSLEEGFRYYVTLKGRMWRMPIDCWPNCADFEKKPISKIEITVTLDRTLKKKIKGHYHFIGDDGGIYFSKNDKYADLDYEVFSEKYFYALAEEKRDAIKNLLIEKSYKMPASDIDAHLKHQNVDEIKELCEEMYHNGEISRTANYRYFVLTEEKKKPKKASTAKSEEVDVEKELEKFKGMLDKGLINQEDYDAKKKELLGL